MNESNIDTKRFYSTAMFLAVFTVAYNLVEGAVSTTLGYSDETLALFGFGLDSFIESISGFGIVVMVMRLRSASQFTKSQRTEFEIAALRTTGWSFYLLSAVLSVLAVSNVVNDEVPQSTFWGVVIGLVSIVSMLLIVVAKRRVGRALQSAPILADANCTLVCVYMSVVLLVSAALYELTQFAYADVIGTALIVWFSVREGAECFDKIRGKECECETCL